MRSVKAAILSLLVCLGCGEGKPEGEPVGTVRIGAVMYETGRRFELAGHAQANGRWEFAEYEVGELLEMWDADMDHALLPPECDDQQADAMFAQAHDQRLPALRRAAHAHDEAAFTHAYAEAATTCNGCHAACQHAFVEIPPTPNHAVPNLDPMPQ